MSRLADLWRGDFGDAYAERSPATSEEVERRVLLWRRVFASIDFEDRPLSFLDVGAGMGANIGAIEAIYRRAATVPDIWAIEPNQKARASLIRSYKFGEGRLMDGTAAKIDLPDGAVDLVYTYGVLIHIGDSDLGASMNEIYRCSKRWIFCAEYFNPDPVSIAYRGEHHALFKRDYGSLWLDKFNLNVCGYGFEWKRMTGLDNVTWWLFQKVK
jgi:pseudaminic acid biosynthesis-associated methylase